MENVTVPALATAGVAVSVKAVCPPGAAVTGKAGGGLLVKVKSEPGTI
jgi:hypothetical protein